MAEAEREKAEFDKRVQEEAADLFVKQFLDKSEGDIDEVEESNMIRAAVKRFLNGKSGADIQAVATEDSSSALSESEDEEESSVSTVTGAIFSESNFSDDEDTDSESEVDNRSKIDSLDKVERSRPWKGVAHLGTFAELMPV